MRIEYKPEQAPDTKKTPPANAQGADAGGMDADKTDALAGMIDEYTATPDRSLNHMKGLSFRKKIGYLLDYYGMKALFTLIVCGMIIGILFRYFSYVEPAAQLLLVNHMSDETAAIEESFRPYLDENGYRDKDYVYINASINFTVEGTSSTHFEEVQAFQTQVASRVYSGCTADEETFQFYADSSYFRDLRLVLSEEEIRKLGEQDRIVYGRTYDTGELYPAGIRLTRENCNWLSVTNYEECVYGLLVSDPDDYLCQKLTEYILNY